MLSFVCCEYFVIRGHVENSVGLQPTNQLTSQPANQPIQISVSFLFGVFLRFRVGKGALRVRTILLVK